jgi:hypothetical protein
LERLRFRNGVRFGESIGRWTVLLFNDTDCIRLCTLYDSGAYCEEGVFLLLRLRLAADMRVFGFSFGLAVGVGNGDPGPPRMAAQKPRATIESACGIVRLWGFCSEDCLLSLQYLVMRRTSRG